MSNVVPATAERRLISESKCKNYGLNMRKYKHEKNSSVFVELWFLILKVELVIKQASAKDKTRKVTSFGYTIFSPV